MHFDDRLATVLRARAGSERSARTQFRQLVDLLGTLPADACGEQVDAAWKRLAEVSQTISADDRASALEEPGLRIRSPRVVVALANAELPVANAAIRAARLTDAEWVDLIPALPPQLRRAVQLRKDLGHRAQDMLLRAWEQVG